MITLEKILHPIKKDLLEVENLIKKQAKTIQADNFIVKSFDTEQIKALSHLFTKPGKRLRPALVLLTAQMLNPRQKISKAHYKLASAIEMIHSASLVHDDIIDESDQRRTQMSLNKKYNNTVAVLVGDLLYAQFFKIIVGIKKLTEKKRLQLLDYLCDITQKMCMGEIWETQVRQNQITIKKDDYLKILKYKTATLMEAACFFGAVIAGADDKTTRKIKEWGYNFGTAYQLIDDYIDKDNLLEIDLIGTAQHYLNKCKVNLNSFQETLYRESLLNLCDYLLNRAI
ncbi:MAG: polyprenyl synthetase family protein [Spirochaetales bacterium]|nr:polyprenyl synthetase family protein [Spirochaetales bacterium]